MALNDIMDRLKPKPIERNSSLDKTMPIADKLILLGFHSANDNEYYVENETCSVRVSYSHRTQQYNLWIKNNSGMNASIRRIPTSKLLMELMMKFVL